MKYISNYSPLDYSDNRIDVYFSIADVKNVINIIQTIDFVNSVKLVEYGFMVKIAVQQIPEIIRYLSKKDIAIYAVIPQ